jgi:hypothetical protein
VDNRTLIFFVFESKEESRSHMSIVTLVPRIDVHSVTNHVCHVIRDNFQHSLWYEVMDDLHVSELMNSLTQVFGPLPGLKNIQNYIVNGKILDSQLGSLNILRILDVFYILMCDDSSGSVKDSLHMTLIDIDMTCIQGISHRLIQGVYALLSSMTSTIDQSTNTDTSTQTFISDLEQ